MPPASLWAMWAQIARLPAGFQPWGAPATLTIQLIPNLSISIPNSSPHGAASSG